jgi:YVTN family beta-propeller protein
LYVAEAGLNAVAVIDTKSNRVMGHIPVGWYPSKVVVSADGRTLYVSNAKGFGSGPNAGPDFESKGRDPYIGGLMNGTISVIAVPADHDLPALTKRVLANNGFPRARPSENLVALRTRIKHIVFITKENRTFDEVFGDVPGANGISSLARYGANATVEAPNQPTLNGINVMPNHRALALRYGISDNFYADGDVSADGHRWLVGIYPNEWMETENAAVYGGQMGWSMTVPGRRAFAGSNASSMPEDYNESGSLFDHLARYHIPFRNYGEGFEFAGVEEDAGTEPTGARESLNIPMSRPLWENTSREFPIFNTNISDQYRTTQFLKDLKDWEDSPSGMPRFVNIALPNDHGAGLRPDAGYPYVASYMADNDLALGRIVEGLSRSRFWKETAIFVTEDDAQGGVDHVDAHRTILIAAGPYIKRGQISHRHASIPSVIHTINLLLGLPPLNQFDATSADLLDLFTTIPDVTGYTAVRPDLRVFNPSNLKDAEGLRMSRDSGPRMDDPAFIREQHEHPNAPTSVETR